MLKFQRACMKKAKSMVEEEFRIDLREMQARQTFEHSLRMARIINEWPAREALGQTAEMQNTDIVLRMRDFRRRNPGQDFGREL